MPVYYENKSIYDFFFILSNHDPELAGLLNSNNSSTPIFFAWSSNNDLQLSPNFAWLSSPDALLVRLPLSLQKIKHLLKKNHSKQSNTIDYWNKPSTNFKFYLNLLTEDIRIKDTAVSNERIKRLMQYSAINWPLWFNDIFIELAHAYFCEKHHLVNDIIYFLQNTIDEVSESELFYSILNDVTPDGDCGFYSCCMASTKYSITRPSGSNINDMSSILDIAANFEYPLKYERLINYESNISFTLNGDYYQHSKFNNSLIRINTFIAALSVDRENMMSSINELFADLEIVVTYLHSFNKHRLQRINEINSSFKANQLRA